MAANGRNMLYILDFSHNPQLNHSIRSPLDVGDASQQRMRWSTGAWWARRPGKPNRSERTKPPVLRSSLGITRIFPESETSFNFSGSPVCLAPIVMIEPRPCFDLSPLEFKSNLRACSTANCINISRRILPYCALNLNSLHKRQELGQFHVMKKMNAEWMPFLIVAVTSYLDNIRWEI